MSDPFTAAADRERSLSDELTAPDQPANGHPLGTPNSPAAAAATIPAPPQVSIIDTILNLDEYLSGDVRRAEKISRFAGKPWLEADIDQLVFELQNLVDSDGTALAGQEVRAVEVATQIQTKQAEYGAAFVYVRMGQMSSEDWKAFTDTWKDTIGRSGPRPNSFYDALIEGTAIDPKISRAQVEALRKKLGDPQMDVLASDAWEVNANSGVSIPKSQLSSLVLRRAALVRS